MRLLFVSTVAILILAIFYEDSFNVNTLTSDLLRNGTVHYNNSPSFSDAKRAANRVIKSLRTRVRNSVVFKRIQILIRQKRRRSFIHHNDKLLIPHTQLYNCFPTPLKSSSSSDPFPLSNDSQLQIGQTNVTQTSASSLSVRTIRVKIVDAKNESVCYKVNTSLKIRHLIAFHCRDHPDLKSQLVLLRLHGRPLNRYATLEELNILDMNVLSELNFILFQNQVLLVTVRTQC